MSTSETPQTGASEQEAPVCYRHPDREAHIRCQRCNRRICPDCMRPAAVGFQCPSCVAEGSRTTRSGRTPYGGRQSGDPTLTSKVLQLSRRADQDRQARQIRTQTMQAFRTKSPDPVGWVPDASQSTAMEKIPR